MTFKIATWNINSVRLRRGLVEKLISMESPDVICLQEIKCRDAEFPGAPFSSLGYKHQAVSGQKGYHGVAILSRVPITDMNKREFCGIGDARHISVSVQASGCEPVRLHNFYIPAGGDIPDREQNQKFGHKLDFLDELSMWCEQDKLADDRSILVGDLNIAPLEHDVWSHKALLKIVSHTPIEVEKLDRALASGPWHDAMRHFVPENEKLYTWWSYRSPDWAAADKGRRLDHVWVSKKLAPKLRNLKVLREARGWEQPSDHVPVIVEMDV
jgi:exodeoxyribonuclease-3